MKPIGKMGAFTVTACGAFLGGIVGSVLLAGAKGQRVSEDGTMEALIVIAPAALRPRVRGLDHAFAAAGQRVANGHRCATWWTTPGAAQRAVEACGAGRSIDPMPRSRRRSRRNPVKLSTTEKVVAGVASVAALGALTYVLVGKSAAAAGPGAPGSSCWQPVASPFTLVPGTYRLAVAIPAAQQASLQTQWTQLGSQLAALQTALPSLRVTGVWAEGWPTRPALPSQRLAGRQPGAQHPLHPAVHRVHDGGHPVRLADATCRPVDLDVHDGARACGRGAASEPHRVADAARDAAWRQQRRTTGGTQQTPSGYTPATNVPAGFNPSATIQGNTSSLTAIPIPDTAGQPQTVDLVTPGETYSAVAIQGGTLM